MSTSSASLDTGLEDPGPSACMSRESAPPELARSGAPDAGRRAGTRTPDGSGAPARRSVSGVHAPLGWWSQGPPTDRGCGESGCVMPRLRRTYRLHRRGRRAVRLPEPVPRDGSRCVAPSQDRATDPGDRGIPGRDQIRSPRSASRLTPGLCCHGPGAYLQSRGPGVRRPSCTNPPAPSAARASTCTAAHASSSTASTHAAPATSTRGRRPAPSSSPPRCRLGSSIVGWGATRADAAVRPGPGPPLLANRATPLPADLPTPWRTPEGARVRLRRRTPRLRAQAPALPAVVPTLPGGADGEGRGATRR